MNTITQDHCSTLETSELVWDVNRDGTATAGRVALPAGDTLRALPWGFGPDPMSGPSVPERAGSQPGIRRGEGFIR